LGFVEAKEVRVGGLLLRGLLRRVKGVVRERALGGVEIGDVVTIYGTDGEHLLATNAVARGIGTVTSDLMCAVSARVTRVYRE